MQLSLTIAALLAGAAVASKFAENVQGKSENEVQAIRSHKTTKAPTQAPAMNMACNILPLDALKIAAKYGMNLSNPVHIRTLSDAVNGNLLLGRHTQFIMEANDANRTSALVVDGLSGDTSWPFGQFKPLLTVGEINQCEKNHGEVYVGVPDGMGAYLKDSKTVRVVVQSESYGPLYYESYPWFVNGKTASFTGSHIQYADFDRESLANFMNNRNAASSMITGFGQVATKSYNLKGQLVGPRNRKGPTKTGAHYSNTDSKGNYVISRGAPTEADWLMQSLCSAHLEEKHQWGAGRGFEDDVFLTNEEWIDYVDGSEFVGISAHVIDLKNSVDYAIGVVTNSGFEKIVEINPEHEDYVVLAVSGYNGAFDGHSAELAARNAEYGNRPDGKPYVMTRDIVPNVIYIGVKGKKEDGSDAPANDFLARNGLRYGKLYGFAVDMAPTGPTGGLFRDNFHKPRANGARVDGKFVELDWQWNGTVKNFRHDGAWVWQHDPLGYEGTNIKFWTSMGPDTSGSKTEHLSSDRRNGKAAFVVSSTAGYFGHFYLNNLGKVLNAANGGLPKEVSATYYVYQGENDVRAQIRLGGAGLLNIVPTCPGVVNASQNCDNPFSIKDTFEDVDGFELINSSNGLHAIIQEDSGNDLGERMFITKLEHIDDGMELTYMFMAQSGGNLNTRMASGVGVPAGTNDGGDTHEFSGIIDLSGMLSKVTKKVKGKGSKPSTESVFRIKSGDGFAKRMAEGMVPINDKLIAIGLQAHNLDAGAIKAFKADRGGQVLLYKPSLM